MWEFRLSASRTYLNVRHGSRKQNVCVLRFLLQRWKLQTRNIYVVRCWHISTRWNIINVPNLLLGLKNILVNYVLNGCCRGWLSVSWSGSALSVSLASVSVVSVVARVTRSVFSSTCFLCVVCFFRLSSGRLLWNHVKVTKQFGARDSSHVNSLNTSIVLRLWIINGA